MCRFRSLVGSHSNPFYSLFGVSINSMTIIVKYSDIILSRCITLLSSHLKPIEGILIVFITGFSAFEFEV